MQMRNKILITTLASVFVPILVVSGATINRIQTSSLENFLKATEKEIRQVDNSIELFFQQVSNNVEFLSEDEKVRAVSSDTSTYFGEPRMMRPESAGPEEATIFEFYGRFKATHPELLYVYLGTTDGGFIQYPGEEIGNYDPRQRPWYQEAMANPDDTIITAAYQGVTGGPMVSVARTIYSGGSMVGVQSMDVTLSTLTDIISAIRLGERGYLILIDETDTVLADPRKPDNNFKKLEDIRDPLYSALRGNRESHFTVDRDGVEEQVTVYRSPNIGWQFVGVIESAEIEAVTRQVQGAIFTTAILMLAIFGAIGWWLSARISQPILVVADSLENIASGDGDLTQRLRIISRDETGALASHFNQFLDSIHGLVLGIKQQSNQLYESSNQSNRIAGEIKDVSHAQEHSIEQAANATRDLAGNAQSVAQKCVSTLDAIQDTEASTREGNQNIAMTVEEVDDLSRSIQSSSAAMKELETETENITEILNAIRGIAEQTNLLALNAAIEAARAGEQGRGFAVVADEVRTLAQRSHNSTEEIDQLLSKLVNRTRDVSKLMSNSLVLSESASEQSQKARESFDTINTSIQTIKDMIGLIASASDEQYQTSEAINSSISGISDAAYGVGSSSDTLSAEASHLLERSEDLKKLVDRFKVQE